MSGLRYWLIWLLLAWLGGLDLFCWVLRLLWRAVEAPVWYGQLALATGVTVLAAWLVGRLLVRFLCLRVTQAVAPPWRWPGWPLRLGLVLLAVVLVGLPLVFAAQALFTKMAPDQGAPLAGLGFALPWWPTLPGLLGRAQPGLGAWLAMTARLPAPAFPGGDDWWLAALLACRLVPSAAVLAGGWAVHQVIARCRDLVAPKEGQPWLFEAPPVPLDPARPPRRGSGRSIVVLCDGTGNSLDKRIDGLPALTNIAKLDRALVRDPGQVCFYIPGVGSGATSSERGAARARRLLEALGPNPAGMAAALFARLTTLFGNAFGTGITGNVVAGYQEIVRQYQPGDRIYLLGFSRGAYTARCIAGVIRRCGLLRAGNYHFSEDAVRLYLTRRDPEAAVPLREELIHPPAGIAVELLGLFDTVGALGAPLWGWWFNLRIFRSNRNFSTDPAPIVRHIHHAMAMDERRSQFFPTPVTLPDDPRKRLWTETLEQVWFRGAHADIGGGYADSGLSDIALAWMRERAARHGLRFLPGSEAGLRPDPLAPMHDELARNPGWRVFGSWPRWHPVPGSEADLAVTAPDGSRSWLRGTLHESVLVRAEAYLAARRLDLCPVPPGGVTLQVLGSREWDCMGVILESGVTYRLSWLGGAWRDAMKPPCGPAGQRDAGLLDPARWAFRFRRRLPHEDWMRLCIAVAHPRDWPLREFGLRQALDYLFWHDPRELRRQVLPVGKALEGAERSVLLRNGHPSAGLLYAFANDLWQTAGNNSGALVLRIERVEPAPGAIVNAIDARGHWRAERDGVPLGRS